MIPFKWLVGALVLCSVSFSNSVFASSTSNSIFDQFVAANQGVLPYPVPTLMDRLQDFSGLPVFGADPTESVVRPFALLLPQGRSRQVGSTSFREPRILIATAPVDEGEKGRFALRGLADRLFIGYAKGSNEAEAISWDNDAGEFKFYLIKNYIPQPGLPQAIRNVPKGRCNSCHQSDGPLFSRAPWSESNMNAVQGPHRRSEISQLIIDEVGSDFYEGVPIDVLHPSQSPPAPSVEQRELLAGRFDGMVESANSLIQARKLAQQACGQQFDCKKVYLKSVLEFARYYPKIRVLPRSALIEFQNLLAKSWPQDGFAIGSFRLRDRNPLPPRRVLPIESPSSQRKLENKIDHSPVDPKAARIAIELGFDGLGFSFVDIPLLKKCTDVEFESVMQSREMRKVIEDWSIPAMRLGVLKVFSDSCK